MNEHHCQRLPHLRSTLACSNAAHFCIHLVRSKSKNGWMVIWMLGQRANPAYIILPTFTSWKLYLKSPDGQRNIAWLAAPNSMPSEILEWTLQPYLFLSTWTRFIVLIFRFSVFNPYKDSMSSMQQELLQTIPSWSKFLDVPTETPSMTLGETPWWWNIGPQALRFKFYPHSHFVNFYRILFFFFPICFCCFWYYR